MTEPATILHHESMRLASGSLTFSVENVLFKVPMALLQIHSEVFASMIDVGSENGDPIVLDDSVEAFSEFLLVLLRPLESCLDCSSSSSSDLPKVLKVYTIAHKYRACAIEERVKEIAVGLATPDDIRSHISPSLTAIQIYDTAIDVECEEIAGVLRGVIVEDSWGGKITPFDMLALGECFDDPEFLGLAHYQIVLLGRDVWSNSSHLTISHRDHLTTGLLNLYKEWDTVLKAWTSEDGIFHDCASLCGTGESLWKVYQRLNVDNLPSFNVIGRLKIIEMIRFDCDCAQRIPTLVKWKREEIERKLPDLFSLRGRK